MVSLRLFLPLRFLFAPEYSVGMGVDYILFLTAVSLGYDSHHYDTECLLEFSNGIDMPYHTHIIRIAKINFSCS